ncbi:MAG: glycogen-binding domain-containing protein [Victivallales bacterium]|nr:glycogen-binding domain-containing protein [Victivallales bacterium]
MEEKVTKKTRVHRKTLGKFIRRKVVFTVKAPATSKVCLAGSFNDWNPEKKVLKYNKELQEFSGFLYLMPGKYEYKFVVDGVWRLDEANPNYVANDMNSMNSIVEVQ